MVLRWNYTQGHMPAAELEQTLAGKFCRLRTVWHLLDEHESAGACGQPTELWDEEKALKDDIKETVVMIKLAHAGVAV
eukprot:374112-Rhodomonas_salina.1